MFVEQVNAGVIERGFVKVLREVLEERLAEIVCVYGSQKSIRVEIHNLSIWLYDNVSRRKVAGSLNFDAIHAAIAGIEKIEFGELCDLLEEAKL